MGLTLPSVRPFVRPLAPLDGMVTTRYALLAALFSDMGQHFKTQPTWISLTGGVLGIELILLGAQFAEAEDYLREKYGVPEPQERWHPTHTPGRYPLRFNIAQMAGVEFDQPDHINLIMIGNRADRRRTMISAT